jgi:hypothetical protein
MWLLPPFNFQRSIEFERWAWTTLFFGHAFTIANTRLLMELFHGLNTGAGLTTF